MRSGSGFRYDQEEGVGSVRRVELHRSDRRTAMTPSRTVSGSEARGIGRRQDGTGNSAVDRIVRAAGLAESRHPRADHADTKRRCFTRRRRRFEVAWPAARGAAERQPRAVRWLYTVVE